MYKQLVQPDLTIVGKVAWCLSYADDVFHTPHGIPTAWRAWELTKYKHEDKSFPDVAVPVWFDYYIGKEQFGHVAVRLKNGQIYSSPMLSGKPNAIFNSVEAIEKFLGATYVGWSEDISNVRVAIEEDDVSTVGDNEIDQASWQYFGYGASQEFIKIWRDTESNTFSRMMFEHPVAVERRRQVDEWRKAAESGTGDFVPVKEQLYKKGK